MITDHDPGDEDDRDDERIVAAVMRRSRPVATSKRSLRPSIVERRAALGLPERTTEERREQLAANLGYA